MKPFQGKVALITGGTSGIGRATLDSTGGFAVVLAGAKAFLEHNIVLNLIADRFQDDHIKKKI